ncbi:hypothetical protein E9549_20860 [Blastococcus sp. MG754426]|uniref:hypothetical protein n=1 Tax=unclassified Blastococcus TaxID=2619396 RepID=UPI001EF1146E|nr:MULTISPECIES: hypothetical protein [unclassified Blastococcus]MCF6509820.1 hypothetical protein [Blastococcus sp. MG754426]MCF6514206.1 hypothetical protein [Blastococcus sp. MG754427]
MSGQLNGHGGGDEFTIMRRSDDPLPVVAPTGLAVARDLLGDLLAGLDDPHAFLPLERHVGRCRVCGDTRELTFEHVPPASAGNTRRARGTSSWTAATSPDPLAFPSSGWVSSQRGVGGYVFCGPCNHTLGRRVVPAYGELARTVTDALAGQAQQVGHLPGTIDLQLGGWPLGAVARAGLAAVMAVGVHDRLLRRHPELSDLLLGHLGRLPRGLRLGLTVVVGGRARMSAPVCSASPAGCTVFAEAALQPFAWTLSFEVPPLRPLSRSADVSHWLQHDCDAVVAEESLAAPVGFLDSPLPGDFRPASDIKADMPPAGAAI